MDEEIQEFLTQLELPCHVFALFELLMPDPPYLHNLEPSRCTML